MKGLYILAAAAIGFAAGCADNAQVSRPAPATTNAAVPASTVEKGVETPNPSVAPTTAMTTSPGRPVANDRDPPERISVSR